MKVVVKAMDETYPEREYRLRAALSDFMLQSTLRHQYLTFRFSYSMSPFTRLATVVALALVPAIVQAQDPAPAKDTTIPKADSAAPAADALDKSTLTGFYELAPGRGLTITLDKDQLYGEPSSGEKRKLIYQSGTAFAVDGTKMTLTFILGADGRASDLIMAQNGQTRMVKRVR